MKCISTLVVVLALTAAPARAQIIERVLVKVNGDIFTQTELEERQTAAIRAKLGVDLKPEAVKDDAELKKALDEVTPQLLVDGVDELLLLQMGKEKGYHLSDEQFKGWLDNLRKEQNLTDAQVREAVEQNPELTPAERQRVLDHMRTIILASNRRVDVTLSTTGQQSVREFPFNAADSLTLIKAEETKRTPSARRKAKP